MRVRDLQGPWDDSKDPGIHRRTRKAREDHGTRELQAQLRAPGRSSRTSLPQSQHTKGHAGFSNSSLGKRRVGEAFPRRGGLQGHLLCLWVIPFHIWIHEIRPRGASGSALTATDTKPSRGIPTAFPEFLQSSAKLPLSIRITGEKIFSLFPSVQGI